MLRFTALGLEMRAVTQNRRMAASMGIPTARVDALTFGLGSGIAGIAGVALSQIDNVSPNLGQSYIIDSFMVVVFGGVGNLWGTLVGALTLGMANKFLEPVAARCSPRSPFWCSSSCSSRSGRAACSRSRAGRWKHDDVRHRISLHIAARLPLRLRGRVGEGADNFQGFFRHCEERLRRSNPVLLCSSGLLRFARNDGAEYLRP